MMEDSSGDIMKMLTVTLIDKLIASSTWITHWLMHTWVPQEQCRYLIRSVTVNPTT
jgi:hypothetical protein